jgi:ribosome-associated protein
LFTKNDFKGGRVRCDLDVLESGRHDGVMAREFGIYTEFITLGQLVKALGMIGNGGEIKMFLAETEVLVNGEIDQRRGRKIRVGDRVIIGGEEVLVVSRD